MRKLLLLLTVLLTGVSGAWAADTLPASTWNILSALPTDSWVAMGASTPQGVKDLGSYTAYYRTQEITIETVGLLIDINFLYSSGNHRLEILGVDALNGSSEVVASDYHFGYTGSNKDLNNYLLKGLAAGTYTLRYIINSGVSNSKGNITINKFEADYLASLPKLTTDESNPQYYSLGSYDRGGYLTSNGAGQGMTHVAFAAGSSWYFTAISSNKSGSVVGGVIAHCSDGTQMKQNWQTAASGETVYILQNGYNNYGLCISKTLPISANSCCDASNANTGVGNWYPRAANDWQGTTWVINPTVPIGQTGYYYFKGMATDRHPYLYSDFVGKSTTATYHHDLPGSPNNGHIWKVTNNGTSFTATNGEGLPVVISSTSYKTLNLSAASAGPDYFFTEAINLTNWGTENGNEQQLTTWTDGGSSPADNRWTFELVDVSTGVYNVVVQGNDDGYVTYSGQNAKNGGFFVASSIAVGDLTAYDIDGYTEVVSVEGHTITVSYNQLLSYTLTDANGATYEGTYNGPVGVTPTFTGCSGYTLTDGSWSGTAYSATINFPFAVSSNNVENQTFLGAFHTKSGYFSEDFLWHANGTSVIVHSGDIPDATQEEQQKYQWLVKPSITDLNITFTIKNVSTGKYIYSETTTPSHSSAVILNETASPLTYSGPLSLPSGSSSTATSIYAFMVSSSELYLSVNSVFGGADAQLGVHNIVHDGISVGFHTFADLISRYWTKNNIAAEIAKAGQYGYPTLLNEYTVALNGVKTAMNSGSYTGNKTNYNNLRTWYEGFLAADVVAPVAGDFLRIKASDTNKSAWSLSGSNLYLTSSNCASQSDRVGFAEGATATDNTTIFYYDGSNLTGFANGLQPTGTGTYAHMSIGSVGTDPTIVSFESINSTEQHAFRVEFSNGVRSMYTQRGGSEGSYYYHTDAAGGNETGAHYRYFLEKVTSLPVTISALKFASFCAPVAVTIPEGVTAYVATSVSGEGEGKLIHLSPISGTIIPANTGVILYANVDAATTYDFEITTGGTATSILSGTTAAISWSEGMYTLQRKDEENSTTVGFYGNETTNTVVPGFKAYYVSGGSAKGFSFSFDDETIVRSLEELQLPTAKRDIFNLAGQRMNKLQRGVNIVNGKKIIVK